MNTVRLQKSSLAVISAASTDPEREVLGGVNISDTGVCVATDGRMLALCAPTYTEELVDESAITVGRDDIKRFAQVLGSVKKIKGLPAPELELTIADDEQYSGHISSEHDPDPKLIAKGIAIEENYPNWRSIMNEPECATRTHIGLEVLDKIVKTAKAAKAEESVTFTIGGDPLKPIRYSFLTADGNEVIGCFMQMRSGHEVTELEEAVNQAARTSYRETTEKNEENTNASD